MLMVETVLMNENLKIAIQALSRNRLVLDTKMAIRYGKNRNKKSKNMTTNDFKIVMGAGDKRKEMLKRFGLPGSKVCAWMMDSPITRYWQPRVNELGKALGIKAGNIFDKYDKE